MDKENDNFYTKNIEVLFGMSVEQFDFYIRCEYNVLNIVNVDMLKTQKIS